VDSVTIARTLVTFLHVAFADRDKPDALPAFREANYDLGEQKLRPEGLFGLALLGHMIETGRTPDTLAILGTPGSSWGRLMARVIPGATDTELAMLDDKSRASQVADDDLSAWAPRLTDAIRARFKARKLNVETTVTGYASDELGQRRLIEHIAGHVPQGGLLTVDATHGLRHLPLLAVFSAMALRRLKNVTVDGIYYGALDRSEKNAAGVLATPVWQLDGLPLIADWLAAMSAFDKDGDYGVFAPLLELAGVDKKLAGNLSDAAFAELIGNFDDAQSRLTNFRKSFESKPLSGVAELFRDELLARISWITDSNIYARQRRLAFGALERGDAVRAATWGFEAFVSRLASNPLSEAHRKAAIKDYFKATSTDVHIGKAEGLREMRNRVAHASYAAQPYDAVCTDVARLMAKRETCLEALRDYLTTLLPEAD
jgi:CRISPR-associated Csx2 family protein